MVNPGAENKGCLTSGNEKGGGGGEHNVLHIHEKLL